MTWFYGATAEQDVIFMLHQAARNNLGVLVVDVRAVQANMPCPVVPFRYGKFDVV